MSEGSRSRLRRCFVGTSAIVLIVAWGAFAFQSNSLSINILEDSIVSFWWGPEPDPIAFTPVDTGSFSNIEPQDYLGPQACRSCHTDKYATWSEHRHRWMNTPASPSTVVGDFTGATIDYFGGQGEFSQQDERYVMRLRRGELQRRYQITQTIGSRFFQYYVGKQVEGPEPSDHKLYRSEHVLPFGYWISRKQWVPVVHVEQTREGEPSLVDEMRRDPFSDPALYDYAQSCSQCHTTLPGGDWLIHKVPGFPPSPRSVSFDLGSYVRDNHPELVGANRNLNALGPNTITDLLRDITVKKAPVFEQISGITCETCHYGARVHVESGGEIFPKMFPVSPRLRIEAVSEDELKRTPTNQNWTCSRCHIGKRFEFAAGMGTWNSTEYTDALKGACYRTQSTKPHLRCIDCHNPHVTTGRGWKHSPDYDDGLCLKCHEEFEPEPRRRAHTHHPSGTAGSRCMNCHMPRLTEGLQDMVRTHMIFSPTNDAMIQANQPNACNMCHVERSIQWTLGYLDQWYGTSYAESELGDNYPGGADQPATVGWLNSWHPTTQMVAVDALTKAKAEWALPELVRTLDSDYLITRQFAQDGIEEMLDISLNDYGYRFYMLGEERRVPMRRLRGALLGEAPTDGEMASFEEIKKAARETERYRQFVKLQPDSANGHYYLGNALMKSGDTALAIASFRRATELEPDHARAHNNLGVALRAQGALKDAVSAHQRAVELAPNLSQAHLALGNALVDQGEFREGEDAYRKALRLDPSSAEAHYNLANAFQQEGTLDRAIEHYRKALETRPKYAEALNNLGIALQSQGELSEAIDLYRQCLVSSPVPDIAASAYTNLGWALKERGQLSGARAQFRAALTVRPGSIPAAVGLAYTLAADPNEATRDANQAVRLAEGARDATGASSPEVLDTLAIAYAAAGRFSEASETAEKALELLEPEGEGYGALRRQIQERLDLFRQGRAYVEPR